MYLIVKWNSFGQEIVLMRSSERPMGLDVSLASPGTRPATPQAERLGRSGGRRQ